MQGEGYDIIGDIHGCASSLDALFDKLGYRTKNGVYRHEKRQVVFLGDFIDRGPLQREVIDIVRPMIEQGFARSVMGNHEYNAIAYATENRNNSDYLRRHTPKNDRQHQAFLDAYPFNSLDYLAVIEWFKTLPLWLDAGDFRVVHACWDSKFIEQIGSPLLNEELLHASCDQTQWQNSAIETLLKGREIPLPVGHFFHDKDGHARHDIRVRWWDSSANTYSMAFLGSQSARSNIPDDEIEGDHLIDYAHDEPPVFLGHYWMEGEPELLAPNIACTDYSVAKPGGKLVAYRWNGEATLVRDNYVAVERVE